MTLPEKLLELRTAQNMSQGDLAEKLEVSRQSVSKWETGQSVPDLEKMIKLADLYGVTVDELVREEIRPEPQQNTSQIIYVEKKRDLSPVQMAGIVMEATGAGLAVLGLAGAPLLVFAGAALVALGLPPLLSQKHPLLICGWILAGGSCLIFNRWTSAVNLRWAFQQLVRGEILYFASALALGRAVFVLFLAACTWHAWRQKKRKSG